MNKFLALILLFSLVSFLPVPVSALTCSFSANQTAPSTFAEVLCVFVGFINTALPIIIGVALLVFFWGLVQVIRGSGDENKVAQGKQLMFWGVIALFVMISFVGILNLFYSDFFGGTIGIPQLPESNNQTSIRSNDPGSSGFFGSGNQGTPNTGGTNNSGGGNSGNPSFGGPDPSTGVIPSGQTTSSSNNPPLGGSAGGQSGQGSQGSNTGQNSGSNSSGTYSDPFGGGGGFSGGGAGRGF